MRPIVTRTERVAVNIADGFARATNGERIAPCVTQ
jgi:thiamine pyrophosphate-dependent acetolactate synthase large subunit-like protein